NQACGQGEACRQDQGTSQASLYQEEVTRVPMDSEANAVTSRGPLTTSAVWVDRLEKTLGSNKVLRGISLEAHSGEIFGLLGPNGAGKTTTLRIICTLLAPDAGSVEVLGFNTRIAPQEVRRR